MLPSLVRAGVFHMASETPATAAVTRTVYVAPPSLLRKLFVPHPEIAICVPSGDMATAVHLSLRPT
jgi:hypothetical protein